MVEHTRIGIVDMGSNAIRFLIADVTASHHDILASHRLAVRLGHEVFQSGEVSAVAMAATVEAFCQFRSRCENDHVTQRRAIATSAMRDASNRDEVIDRVFRASGFAIEVITGEQEANLLKIGIETQIDLSQGTSLLADVGGGSVEVTVVHHGIVQSACSYPLGAVRLLQSLQESNPNSHATLLQQQIERFDARIDEQLQGRAIDRYAAVGGNIDNLTQLVHKRLGANQHAGVDVCRLEDLAEEVQALMVMTAEQRVNEHDLLPDRADTIVPAGLVYLQLGRLAKQEFVLAPHTGIKEGLLLECRRDCSRA